MPGTALRNGKWKLRALIFAALIGPLYIVPSLFRVLLLGRAGWLVGVALSDLAGSLFTGFLTNNYRFAAAVYGVATAFELSLILMGHQRVLALWVGDLVPALVAIYFAQQLYINMGD